MDDDNLQEDTGPSSVSRLLPRSCQLCHQRKIRCDKKKGSCSNCLRVNIPCHYPGTERKARRPHKTTITDVASRVAKLERAVAGLPCGHGAVALAAQTAEDNGQSHALSTVNDSQSGEGIVGASPGTPIERESSMEELLVQDGGLSRYINETLFSRVEERVPQSVSESPNDYIPQRSNELDSIDIGMPFSHFRKPVSGDQLQHPSRRHAIRLWRTYVDNFDPVGKILHVPSMEAVLFGAINDLTGVDSDLSALLFGIYFAAITTLDSSDVVSFYGEQKGPLLSRLKEGLEQSLAASDFLARPTMRSIQAMAIYLRCLRAYNLGRSAWTLFGLLMRAAQFIGLHRDGLNLKLQPFETEMRRRLWWFIFSIDSRAAEEHGISVSEHMINSSGTRFPSNIYDSSLSPGITELPLSSPTWTTMTFSLVVLESSLVIYRTLSSSSCSNTSKESRDQILKDHLTRMEEQYLNPCNPDIPAQRATFLIGMLLSTKARFINQQRELKRISGTAGPVSAVTEESLLTACEVIEMTIKLQTEEILRDFHWLSLTYTQYHPLLYVFWHLYVKPTGPNVDRAWATGLQAFEIASSRESISKGELNWAMVQNLVLKASERRRECADVGLANNDYSALLTPGDLDDPQGPNIWDINSFGMADWGNLADDFKMYELEN